MPPEVVADTPLFTPGGLILSVLALVVGAAGIWMRERKDRPTVKRQADQIESLETRAKSAEERADEAARKASQLDTEVAKLGGALKQQYDFAQAIEVLKTMVTAVRDSITSGHADRSILNERLTEHSRANYEEHNAIVVTLKEQTVVLRDIKEYIEQHNGWDQKTERRVGGKSDG